MMRTSTIAATCGGAGILIQIHIEWDMLKGRHFVSRLTPFLGLKRDL